MARAVARAARGEAPPRLERAELAIPAITADLRPRIGSSQIDEFVLEHGARDILRELVQNEFDAGGTEMTIRFGEDAFSVVGSGAPIKRKGWTRLSVIMGTGEVIGDGHGEQIEPKENGIGSKNFGLRALFSYADRIHVRSDGQMAILDVRNLVAGVQRDPESAGRAGVLVQAPYRHAPLRRLPPFTVEREKAALQEIERALFPTLVKLAVDGAKPGLRRLKVIAERTGIELEWRQSTRAAPCKTPRVTALVRKGRLSRRDTQGTHSAGSHEEIEFSRFVDIPAEYAALDFPGYYRRGGRVKIAVSLETKAGKLVTGRAGRFYYPLQASHSRTGCAVSVSGPFHLNADRSRLNDTDWNTWLKARAADLVIDLLGTDWFARFGASAYEALDVLDVDEEPGNFQSLLRGRLTSAACWMSQAGRLEKSSDLVTADEEVLEGHLDQDQQLHPQISRNPAARALALASGMPRFTLSSLVVLRCAPQNTSILKTHLAKGEADYRHDAYAVDAARLEEQVRTARALTQLQKRLTPSNRSDLAETASALSASGALRPAVELVLVPPDLWEGCPIPLDDRLHPDLAPHRAVSGRCKPFKLQIWVGEAAARARNGTISDNERAALYRHLTAADTKLSGPVLAMVRRSPVLRTADGQWAAAEDLLWPPVKDQALMALAVPAPATELRTRALLQRLRIRRDVRGADLVAVAEALPDETAVSSAFEALLRRNFALLTAKTVGELQDLPILRGRSGALAEPARLHLPTPVNLACVEALDELVAGDEVTLYRRLGCRETPASTTLLAILDARRERGEPPPHSNQFYPALVEALRAERQSVGWQLHRRILYVDGAYVTPFQCLASARAPKCLWGAVPVYRGGVLADAYLALGAAPIARDQHWAAFFEWIDARAKRSATATLTATERGLLLEAYRRISGPPEGLSDTAKWLLSDRGTVHSLTELREDRFLENDFPELAEALKAAGAPVAFAASTETARSLYRLLRLHALSQVCGEGRVSLGPAAQAPNWFRADKELDLLRGEELAAAVHELAFAHQKQAPAFHPPRGMDVRRRIKAIRHIRFVQSVQRTYSFVRRASVTAEAAVDGEALVVRPPSHRYDFLHILAGELAQLAGAKRLPDIRNLVSAILPLLQANTPAERAAYLKRQGIRLPGKLGEGWSDFEDDLHDLGEDLVRGLVEGARGKEPGASLPPAPPAPPALTRPAAPSAPAPLPPIDQVTLTVSAPQGVAPAAAASGASGGGAAGRALVWQPRTPAEMVRDAEVGRRGEELVYRMELERVRAMGRTRPEDDVVWTSQTDPGADHDIRSIGEDSQPIWIEVKTTTGTDGRFDWPRREFEKALREGARYQLWRVYNGASGQPEAKMFPDPIALIKSSRVRLEIGDLRAFVESRSR